MTHETKAKVVVAAICAVVGYGAAPKALKVLIKLSRLAQEVANRSVKEIM